ncbi:MobC family plasmid mobilization relaxosome protein [Bacteroides ovatus]|uniref:MobC family plasmid mobilization relaxosome protein n=2 Tax=Bacteroides TaxID=816 RepID=A0A7J5LKC9_BACSE|nr:MobC family plasmid mobilization relaxosome protein [Bacteroides stercoris]KAA4621354.1 MobC family plasmid mobilization relaxosome protein [Bacteroides ovatus]KAA4634604.1 MobC family plasmid mobilization relaxosome protein [Bacteroides ovatus]KAA4669233.1 MobC family plasmid mobilization relaxosome protein [Bacteroides ovatus]KAA4678597.1 MobC family plasmid mobilization relaxosome protein [Bacteroides ovatus]KAB5317024.1 MobC family plasmid mobilization relaxosome protein [Bacteroides st
MTEIKDKPGGRPVKKTLERRNRVVSTKLTKLQYYAVKRRAGEAGVKVSEYVRQAIITAEVVPRLNRQDADTIRKLAGEANNLNQLAHRANAGGFALVAVELVKLKNGIVEIINQLSDDWKNKKGKRF